MINCIFFKCYRDSQQLIQSVYILHCFTFSGSADAILALVKAGANVEVDDKDGLTGTNRVEGLQKDEEIIV